MGSHSLARVTEDRAQPPSFGLLALPTFGLALSMTTVASLVPLLLREYTDSRALIGAVVSMEGALALVLPLWLGARSDRTQSRLGSRLPFLVLGAPICAIALCALPFAGSLPSLGALCLLFYAGYYTCYSPYRALFVDLVPPAYLCRSQGVQTLFREFGLGVSLVACPALLAWWRPMPFVLCATVVLALSLVFVQRISGRIASPAPSDGTACGRHRLLSLLADTPQLWRVLAANALWEFAIAGLKTFVVLFVVAGTGRTMTSASGLLGGVVLVAVLAAPIAGRLGDRFGTLRVVRCALTFFAAGALLPFFTQSLSVLLPVIPLIAFSGAVTMTLPYALIAQYLPDHSHGAGAGLYDFSRGLGNLLGPVVTGAVIDLLRAHLPKTQGYAALWLVVGSALFLSIALLPRTSAERRVASRPRGMQQSTQS